MLDSYINDLTYDVAPLAGAWIEISVEWRANGFEIVAPLAGAWIEIHVYSSNHSLFFVAPLAGAWIEIDNRKHYCADSYRRSPRGSVD